MADSTQLSAFYQNDPTRGFTEYTLSVKPYHTKILETLVEYVYTDVVNVTLGEAWDWSIITTQPDIDTLTSCGFGVVWDAYITADDYPTVSIIQAVGPPKLEAIFLSNILNPTNVVISYNPDLYIINIGDPVTIQLDGLVYPTTTTGSISPGRIYYVVSVTGNTIELSLTLAGTPIVFTSTGTGTFKVHPENLKYNSFLIDQEVSPVDYQCVAVNTVGDKFAFINTYPIINVSSSLQQWTVTGILLSAAYQDVTFGTQKVGGDVTGLANDATVYTAIVVVDGVINNISIVGSAAQTFTTLLSEINNDLTGAVSSLVSGDIRITSSSIGAVSSIEIIDGTLFSALTQFSGIQLAINDSIATPGKTLYIRENSNSTSNGAYTIASASISGSDTIITVVEPISSLTQVDGSLNIQDDFSLVPRWIPGQKVQLTTSGTFPSPLAALTDYYFIPTDEVGIFTLWSKRFSLDIMDRINITTLGTGIINIHRSELFYPGATISVSGTYKSRNNGVYYVRSIVAEGSYLRINVTQKVQQFTPSFILTDGTMSLDSSVGGYDYPQYCELLQAPELYTEAFIHEYITFEFTLNLTDAIASVVNESTHEVCDVNSFPQSATAGYVILPTGFDTQFFDLGPLDEGDYVYLCP